MNVDPSEVAAHLSDRDLAMPVSRFPTDMTEVSRPGMYSWWVDEEGRETLESSLGGVLPFLIYAGQAGATSVRSGKQSSATLGSRIGGNHLKGTAYGSTFRKSISSLLLEPLGLTVKKPDRLTIADRGRVTDWMRRHLSVVIYPYDDRDSLRELEVKVLQILDPPLNLEGMEPTTGRRLLSDLRRRLSRPASGRDM